MSYQLYVGIDVSAQTFSAAWTTNGSGIFPTLTLTQNLENIKKLKQKLLASGFPPAEILVVMEATGTYWIKLATRLHEMSFVVSVINPRQSYNFAKALMQNAKTDPLDSQMLARLALLFHPEPWSPPPPIFEELQQRFTQRDDLLAVRQQLRNQKYGRSHRDRVLESVNRRADEIISVLDKQIAQIDIEIRHLLIEESPWRKNAQLLLSIPGLSFLTVGWLLIATHNFAYTCDAEELAAFAGLVPYPRQSGTSLNGKRQISYAGHQRLRTALYMATLSAAQHNPIIREFYMRLVSQGKPKKVARCAAARKLIHLAWAIVNKQQPFNPHYKMVNL